jgi:hypothetical protein
VGGYFKPWGIVHLGKPWRWYGQRAFALLAFIGIAVGIFLANYSFVKSQPGGNDFLARWMGARFFLQGVSPYDDRVGLETQTIIYGHPADPAKGEDLELFVYPLYSMPLFVPFALADFPLARALWITFEEIALFMALAVTFTTIRYSPTLGTNACWMLFALTWYFSVRALINGNPIIFVTLFLVCSWKCIRDGRWLFAGLFLAFATMKPQVTGICIAWMVLWALQNRHWKLVGWFGAWMVALIGAALVIEPNWIIDNMQEAMRYGIYTEPASPSAIFNLYLPGTGFWIGVGVSLAVWAILFIVWWRMRKADFSGMVWAAGMMLAMGFWSGIQNDPGNQFILLPVLICILSWWSKVKGDSLVRDIGLLIALWIGLWGFFFATLKMGNQPIQSPWMLFVLPLIVLVGLFWMRPRLRNGS